MDKEHHQHPLLEPASRGQELQVGFAVLAAGLLLGYFGVRGAILFLGGSRAAPADPIASAIGIVAGIGGTYLGTRLLTGWRNDGALLPTFLLFVGGIGPLAGGVSFYSLGGSLGEVANAVYVCGLGGIMALVLSWRRWRKRPSRNAA